MALNKQKGNMYPWVTHTWNPIGGRCPHQCTYCYMHGLWRSELQLREHFLKDNLGKDRTIFVGSSTDMWAESVPSDWILDVLVYCKSFDNTYLFQTKNPVRFPAYTFPLKTILGTTIETNRVYPLSISGAPSVNQRIAAMCFENRYPKMISIEPIMDFDLETLVYWINGIAPKFVSIGADSKGHNLPEPSAEKVKALMAALREFTEVRPKKNLERLMK